MKICAFSDMHGIFLYKNIKPCDILLICGDIVPLNIQTNIPKSDKWFKEEFIPWCCRQPVDKVFLIAGNHDFFMLNRDKVIKEYLINTKIYYLNNENVGYEGINIFGTPDCHIFGSWAFMYSPEKELIDFNKIYPNCDILMSHDAAMNHSDCCLEIDPNKHIGNEELRQVVERVKPKWHVFGHLHTCDHNIVDYFGTKTACVSLLNEQYNLVYNPLYFEI